MIGTKHQRFRDLFHGMNTHNELQISCQANQLHNRLWQSHSLYYAGCCIGSVFQLPSFNLWMVQSRVHAIWSYNERWDFPRAGSSLFLPRFSVLMFLRFLGPFFIFSEIFTSGDLYFLFCALIFHIFSSIIPTQDQNQPKAGFGPSGFIIFCPF